MSELTCPKCNSIIDRVQVMNMKAQIPKDGDLTIGKYCGTLLRYEPSAHETSIRGYAKINTLEAARQSFREGHSDTNTFNYKLTSATALKLQRLHDGKLKRLPEDTKNELRQARNLIKARHGR